MERKPLLKRFLAGILAFSVAVSSVTFVMSAEESGYTQLKFREVSNDAVSAALPGREPVSTSVEAPYADDESVRVSIVLDGQSTIESGYEVQDIAQNAAAMSYRAVLQTRQDQIVNDIERVIGGGLDVVWNLTLAANIISANVEYGQIEDIEKVNGVKEVLIETQYFPQVLDEKPVTDPNMATSNEQIGSNLAWASGYTGAGSRVAVIDTGTDDDHQSFAEAGYLYSLEKNAEKSGISYEEYVESLDLLTKEEIESVKDQLNAGKKNYWSAGSTGVLDPEEAFITRKLAYGYNYVDHDYDINHDNDNQGEHGSHVAGIATANSWIETGSGYQSALEYAHMQGVAPDAQLLTMKVFGKEGGAYPSDYMAAIEDAIILKADSINLSLGAANPGHSRAAEATYQAIMDNLTESGVVVSISAGNSGYWSRYSGAITGNLYADDVSMQMNGAPGSFTNSFTVASVDNIGTTGSYFIAADGSLVFYIESPTDDGYKSITTLSGEREYILITGLGYQEDWAALADVLEGKIAICSRGDIPFAEKAMAAVDYGAIATVIYNNEPGVFGMLSEGYEYKNPFVSITMDDGFKLLETAEEKTTEDGVIYYEGTITINEGVSSVITNNGSNMTISDFSSWGVPGSLELKPEITAPGGNIYSVNGALAGGTSYENMSGTSMASPQIAGMSAVAAQYIRENDLVTKTGQSARTLIQSLLMSTATPLKGDFNVYAADENGVLRLDDDYNLIVSGKSEGYYPVMQQGAGLANIFNVVNAESFILMGEDATASAADGKVKAELGDDPNGEYTFSFSINNITDEELTYDLSADLFTQDHYKFYSSSELFNLEKTAWYMAENTVPLNSRSDFLCDGKSVNTVTVPPNGSKTVRVTLKLDSYEIKELETVFTNGFYVEGYVYAAPATAAASEGSILTTHSIPVLAFCGNWSDPSMYDVGSVIEYRSGLETRNPYISGMNTFAVSYADDPTSAFYFGSNPIDPSETYDESRNAINAADSLSYVLFGAIRNAGESMVEVFYNGNTILAATLGAIDAAYYHVNFAQWYNTTTIKPVGFNPAENGLKEGDTFTAKLTLIPEYYISDGEADTSALGEGAYMSISATVDNTAPVVEDVKYDPESGEIIVSAKDNRYVAGVVLYNRAGTYAYDSTGSKESIDMNETAEYALSTEGLKGTKFLIQVVDYANNVITVECEENVGADIPVPDVMTFRSDPMNGGNNWVSVDQGEYGIELSNYMRSDYIFEAATAAEHYIFAYANNKALYVMPEDDLDNISKVADIPYDVLDLAYNPTDEQLYALIAYEGRDDSDVRLVTIDILTGEIETVGIMPSLNITLACDNEGTFYTTPTTTFIDDWDPDAGEKLALSNSIAAFTLNDIDKETGIISLDNVVCDSIEIGEFGIVLPYKQPMAIDPNTGHLIWFPIDDWELAYYVEVDVKAGEVVYISEPFYEVIYGLVIHDKSDSAAKPEWAEPTDTAIGINISKASVNMFKGGTIKLSAQVKPWTLTDQSVTWSSSDESVATVNSRGVVTANKVGKAVITAASTTTPDVKAACEVTVSNIQVTLNGVLQDDEGIAQYFEWNMETDETWTGGAQLSMGSGITSVTASDKYVYIGTESDVQYQLDRVTGEVLNKGEGYGRIVADEAYSEYFSTPDSPLVLTVVEGYVNYLCDPLALVGDYGNDWDFSYYLPNTDSSRFIAVASMGYTKYEDRNGNVLDTERFVAMTDNGALWSIYIPKDPETGTFSAPYFDYCMTDLPSDFLTGNGDGIYCSLVRGDDEYLYFTAFNGRTSNFYRIEADNDSGICEAIYMGNVGQDIWPAALISVSKNAAVDDPGVDDPGTENPGFDRPGGDFIIPPATTTAPDTDIATTEPDTAPAASDTATTAYKTVSIVGYVRDASGNPLAGVTVELYSTVQTTVTDENGRYEFTNVDFGTHTIIIKDEARGIYAEKQFVIKEDENLSVNDIVITASNNASVTLDLVVNENVISFEGTAENAAPSQPEISVDTGAAAPDNTTAPDSTTNTGNDQNVATGVVLFIAPAAVSAIAVLASKKRRK